MEYMGVFNSNRDEFSRDFPVFDAIGDIIATRKLRADNRLFIKKLDFIDRHLKIMLVHKDNRVTDLITKKDHLTNNVTKASATLATLRTEADEILIKRHIIQVVSKRVATHQSLDLPEVVNWLTTHCGVDGNGNSYDNNRSLLHQVPDFDQLVERYCLQQSVLKKLKRLSDHTDKVVAQLLYRTLRLYNQLRIDGMDPITRAPVFREASQLKLEKFDYYGYSPAGPIVPPIDVSWARDPAYIVSPRDTPSPVFLLNKPGNGKLPAISMNKNGGKKGAKPKNKNHLPQILKKTKIQIVFGRRTMVPVN